MMFKAVPPLTTPTWMVEYGGTKGQSGSALALFRAIMSSRKVISLAAVMTALTPRWTWLECASCPMTVVRAAANPLCDLMGVMLVGSPTITAMGLAISPTMRSIGRAACRERGGQYVKILVVDG